MIQRVNCIAKKLCNQFKPFIILELVEELSLQNRAILSQVLI